jgi:hypothetical protein
METPMLDRPKVQRALLRRALQRQTRDASSEVQKMIRLCLDDEALFETVYESAMVEASRFGQSSGTFRIFLLADGTPVVDNLLKLLQWFIVNGPLLIEIIKTIISLFGSSEGRVKCEV